MMQRRTMEVPGWTSGYVDGPVRVPDGADVVGSRQGRCNALYRLLMLVCRIEGEGPICSKSGRGLDVYTCL